jgi:hypothetical protein
MITAQAEFGGTRKRENRPEHALERPVETCLWT